MKKIVLNNKFIYRGKIEPYYDDDEFLILKDSVTKRDIQIRRNSIAVIEEVDDES